MKKGVFFIFISILLHGCNLKKSDDVEYLPEYDLKTTQSYIATCGQCHAVPHPSRHTIQEWGNILISMDKRMQERKYPIPGQKVRYEIEGYLGKHARN